MKRKILSITETAAMLALLIAGQWATKALGQIVTGSFVNAVLALTVLVVGLSGGLTVAILSPIFAFLLGIAPQMVTVPAIVAGNAVFVLILHFACGKHLWRNLTAWLLAAATKFAVLYFLIVQVVCGLASGFLMEQGVLKEGMLRKLPGMFSVPQLLTALIGGGLALLIEPVVKKALHRE